MSLLTICQDVADVIGLTRPAAIITGTDQLSRQMLGLAKETLEELCFMDWPVLEITYSFNTIANQASYALPSDFRREVGDTVYAASQYYGVRGSLTASDWARQRGSLPDFWRYKFRIFGYPRVLQISPTPQVVENFILEYQTENRVVQTSGTLKSTFFDDTDTPLVPEDLVKRGLKWRVRRAKGLDYSEEFDDYELARSQRLSQALSLGSMPVANRSPFDGTEIGLVGGYVPETGFGV